MNVPCVTRGLKTVLMQSSMRDQELGYSSAEDSSFTDDSAGRVASPPVPRAARREPRRHTGRRSRVGGAGSYDGGDGGPIALVEGAWRGGPVKRTALLAAVACLLYAAYAFGGVLAPRSAHRSGSSGSGDYSAQQHGPVEEVALASGTGAANSPAQQPTQASPAPASASPPARVAPTVAVAFFLPSFSKTAWPYQRVALRAVALMGPWARTVVLSEDRKVAEAVAADELLSPRTTVVAKYDKVDRLAAWGPPRAAAVFDALQRTVPGARFLAYAPHDVILHRSFVAALHAAANAQAVGVATSGLVATLQHCKNGDADAVQGVLDIGDTLSLEDGSGDDFSARLRVTCDAGELASAGALDVLIVSPDALNWASLSDKVALVGYDVAHWAVATAAAGGADVVDLSPTVPALLVEPRGRKSKSAGAAGGGSSSVVEATRAALGEGVADGVTTASAATWVTTFAPGAEANGQRRIALRPHTPTQELGGAADNAVPAGGNGGTAGGGGGSANRDAARAAAAATEAMRARQKAAEEAEAAATARLEAALAAAEAAGAATPTIQETDVVKDGAGAVTGGYGHHHTADEHNAHGTNHPDTVVTMFLTLFPSPVGSQKYAIQLNTLRAMHFLWPTVEVVVFAKEQEIRTMVAPLGLEVVSDFMTNPHGTPYLRSMFEHVTHHADSPFVGYTNADILFNSAMVETLRAIKNGIDTGLLHPRCLIVGQRTNVDMARDFAEDHPAMLQSPDTLDEAVQKMAARGSLFQTDAEDYFIITPGTFQWNEMPDFVIGRPGYDNWLVDYAYHRRQEISLIDATKTIPAVHQTDADGNKAGHKARPDKGWNLALGANGFDHGHTTNANWRTRLNTRKEVEITRK